MQSDGKVKTGQLEAHDLYVWKS